MLLLCLLVLCFVIAWEFVSMDFGCGNREILNGSLAGSDVPLILAKKLIKGQTSEPGSLEKQCISMTRAGGL